MRSKAQTVWRQQASQKQQCCWLALALFSEALKLISRTPFSLLILSSKGATRQGCLLRSIPLGAGVAVQPSLTPQNKLRIGQVQCCIGGTCSYVFLQRTHQQSLTRRSQHPRKTLYRWAAFFFGQVQRRGDCRKAEFGLLRPSSGPACSPVISRASSRSIEPPSSWPLKSLMSETRIFRQELGLHAGTCMFEFYVGALSEEDAWTQEQHLCRQVAGILMRLHGTA